MSRSSSETKNPPSDPAWSPDDSSREYELLRALAHELRTPLGTAFMQAQMLELVAGDGTKARIDSILRGCRQTSSLLDDMLDAVAAERGQLRLQPAPINVVEFVSGFGHRHVHELPTDRIRVEAAASAPHVDCDPARLDRILVNLVGYAIHHAPDKEAVTFAFRTDAHGVVVLMTMPSVMGNLDILTACREFESKRKRADGQSVSLRLYIAWRLSRVQGGDLRVLPNDRGVTTFALTLPAGSRASAVSG